MQKEIKLRQISDTSNVCWDISEDQAMALGYGLCDLAREYLRDPEHMAAFEAWRAARHAAKKEGNANA